MAKSYPVDETRIADSVEQTKRQQRSNVKKAGKTTKTTQKGQPRRKGGVGTRSRVKSASGKTKQQACLDLLSRREGVTIEELQAATGRQQHGVRGFLAGTVKNKLGLTLLSEKTNAGPRRYRISNTV